jgi:hypothetical protein
MSNKRLIVRSLLMLSSAILLMSFANAQDRLFARQGVTELSGSISFESVTSVSNDVSGDATTIFSFAPEIGYFVTDGFEIGISGGITDGLVFPPGLTSVNPPNGNGTTAFQFFLSPSYNVVTPKAKVYPFIELKLGYTSLSSGSHSATGFSWGPRGGVKIPVVDHLLVLTSAQYLLITVNRENATMRTGFNYFSFGFGISGYF